MIFAVFYWLAGIAHRSQRRQQVPASSCLRKIYVHPCVIDNRPHIVYPRGLRTRAPQLFQNLLNYCHRNDLALKEDQRRDDRKHHPQYERRRLATMLLFTAGLVLESAAMADAPGAAPHASGCEREPIELRIVSSPAMHTPASESHLPGPALQTLEPTSVKTGVAARMFDILEQRYQRHSTDPDYVLDDFKKLANYYSGFPEVIAMLDRLKTRKWRLIYREHHWATVASGNVFQVDNATVYFDTRSAAQLRLYNHCQGNPVCIASPADALLHELLHAHSMLVNTGEFLAQGGMNTVLYPYKHEYAIIEAERKLYARMSLRDNIKRPQRFDHAGRFVQAQCPTCIQ